jgi:hypothetical protein
MIPTELRMHGFRVFMEAWWMLGTGHESGIRNMRLFLVCLASLRS